jgi:hypothetical protein
MSSSARHMTPPSRSRIRPIAPPLALFLTIATGSLLSAPALATAAKTRRVSVSSTGAEANGAATRRSSRSTGRFVPFNSTASDLVGRDANDATAVYVRDRQTGKTRRVSVSSTGAEGDGDGYSASISTDGRFVALPSLAANLIGSDTNAVTDVFVRDRQNGTTKRVSVSSAGTEGNEDSHSASISFDGRFVAFGSGASSLVGNDTNAVQDVFVRDRRNGTTRRVSVSSAGLEGNANSTSPSISANGRFVGFYSYATTLVGADTNGVVDVFVRGPLH